MSDTSRLIVGRQSQALKERLWQLVEDAKRDDFMAPVTIIGPSRYANLGLRQELGRNGFINVRFIVSPVLSEMLGAASLAREGRRPLTSALERVSLQALLSQCTGPLGPVREHPSTLASVRGSFRDLRHSSDTVLSALEAQGGVRSELVSLYRKFREQTAREWYDVDDLTASASEATNRGETSGLDDLGLIVFYLTRDISESGAELVGALARQNRCAVLLGLTGDSDADRSILALAETLKPAFGHAEMQEDDSSGLPLLSGDTTLHIAPNAHEELRWVIRQIVQEASEGETPFHRMAILYRTEDPYSSLIRDELTLTDIPTAGPGRGTLAASAVGRTLLGLLELSAGDFSRSNVMTWLTGCPVFPPYGRSPGFNPGHWDSLTRRAGVVGGLEQWRNRLNAYATKQVDDADRREKAEEISSARASAMRAQATAARNALAFVEQLAKDVASPADGSSWSTFCKWASGLLDLYLSHEIPSQESKVRDQIDRILSELADADSINHSTTIDVFRKTLQESLESPVGHLGVTGKGVFVSTFQAAAGMSFDIIWVVGMIEGATPPAMRPDPLLPEPDWISAVGEPRAAKRMESERYDFLSAMASAPRRRLSYPAADGSSQRGSYPSRWFLEQATTLEGSRIHTGDLPALSVRPWLSIDASTEQALANNHAAVPADRHEYYLQRLVGWRASGRPHRHHPLVGEGSLAVADNLSRRRNGRQLTEYDGNISAIIPGSNFAENLGAAPVSATSLEAWAACPFRYFLGHVLRLSALETPEEITTISALDRGLLVHDILERFITESAAQQELPAPGQSWSLGSMERLSQIAAEEFLVVESKGATGKPLLWKLARREITDDLETFLEEDAALRARRGTTQQFVEMSFGFAEDNAPAIDLDTRVAFRGFIDRIDVDSEGESVLVVDYKTGSAEPYDALEKDIIDKGKRLQLGVYSMAAQQLFPQATQVEAAYWFTTTGGGFRFAPAAFFDINDDQVRQRFQQGISTIVSGIRSGVFPANPGPPDRGSNANCRFCDFDAICPSRRSDLWERKKSDGAISDYLSLAEG